MTFRESIQTCFRKYADFQGRARRAEYWWFILFAVIGTILTVLVDALIGGAITGGDVGLPVFQVAFSLGILLPSLAVAVRRLHDTDRSGWWYLIAFVPFVGVIVLIIFFVQRGTAGPNRFGPDPLAGEPVVAA
ncbi:MAG: DUF805 domain-containing protein [Thermaurantiacus sp.]